MTEDGPTEYYVILTDHVFDKVRSIDMTLAEFDHLLDSAEVIETTPIEEGTKEQLLVLEWSPSTPGRCRGG